MIFSVILLFHKVFKSPAKFDKKACYDKEEKKRVALTKSKKKKAEETTMFEKRIKKHLIIDGMLCRHCVASVTEALESLDCNGKSQPQKAVGNGDINPSDCR